MNIFITSNHTCIKKCNLSSFFSYGKIFNLVIVVSLNQSFTIYWLIINITFNYLFCRAIVLYRPKVLQSKFEDAQVTCTETITNQIKSWIQTEAIGLCGERNQGNAGDFQKPLFVAYYNVDFERNPSGTKYWRNRYIYYLLKHKLLCFFRDLTIVLWDLKWSSCGFKNFMRERIVLFMLT